MKISEALMHIIHRNGNSITSAELLNYLRRLEHYGIVEVGKDGLSVRLTGKGLDRVRRPVNKVK